MGRPKMVLYNVVRRYKSYLGSFKDHRRFKYHTFNFMCNYIFFTSVLDVTFSRNYFSFLVFWGGLRWERLEFLRKCPIYSLYSLPQSGSFLILVKLGIQRSWKFQFLSQLSYCIFKIFLQSCCSKTKTTLLLMSLLYH